jgi:hypothetical protein
MSPARNHSRKPIPAKMIPKKIPLVDISDLHGA